MEAKEIAQLIEDLGPRIERLRSLYEQYFMGLEKLEPATLRKDVERSIWQLRKIRIQNTRMRFKLQQLIQRYNTYQQYWARILREMERGTYRRDVLRAAKRVGSTEALTIVGKRRAQMFRQLEAQQMQRQARQLGAAGEDDSVELSDLRLGDGALELSDDHPELPDDALELSDDDLLLVEEPDERPARPPGVARRSETLELDESELELIPDEPVAAEPPPRRNQVWHLPDAIEADADRLFDAILSTDDGAPAAPRPAPQPTPQPAPLGPQPPTPPTPATPPAWQPRPRPGGPPPATPPAAAGRPSLAEPRARELYNEYVKAKRAVKESTAGLTFERLRRSLEQQTQRLSQQHRGKTIDYEVVIQNGRTLIRPVLK